MALSSLTEIYPMSAGLAPKVAVDPKLWNMYMSTSLTVNASFCSRGVMDCEALYKNIFQSLNVTELGLPSKYQGKLNRF